MLYLTSVAIYDKIELQKMDACSIERNNSGITFHLVDQGWAQSVDTDRADQRLAYPIAALVRMKSELVRPPFSLFKFIAAFRAITSVASKCLRIATVFEPPRTCGARTFISAWGPIFGPGTC